jgi:saccharopine dehydrogenase (NADP+, L-glutamate forming)
MNPEILVIGAGKSATVLIQYLQTKAVENNWYIVLADGNAAVANSKWNNAPNGHAVGIDIENKENRAALIEKATVVVSMLPPSLHFLVAQDCVHYGKPLFTASYVDDNMKSIAAAIEQKQILVLCEMGLDPGIDHMSAMELIHSIQDKGGKITGFKSHCGGLIAPESDNNPWHYKISWNANNIILAGKSGALYLEQGQEKNLSYDKLFENAPSVELPSIGKLSYYPNRNSLSYINTYSLDKVQNFIRTTLRHPHFFLGWNAIVQLGLTDESVIHLKENTSIKDWIELHLKTHELENKYASFLQNEIIKNQFEYIGFNSETPIPAQYKTSAAILQWILENKWKLAPTDKDMVVMMHEIEYELDAKKYLVQSSLVQKGKNATETAMATTVGLPLAMGVCAYLKGEIKITGLHIPIHPSIYKPILKSLQEEGIVFEEITTEIK